jgi:hypothetical protein
MTDRRANTLYKIYYGDLVVYLGRTRQPINTRLRGHFFGKPMHRKIDLPSVTRIEIAQCKTVADMYLYEVYYINSLHPPLNCDDKAHDDLTVSLEPLEWREHWPHLMEDWAKELREKDDENTRRRMAARARELSERNQHREVRGLPALSEAEYFGNIVNAPDGGGTSAGND